MRLAIEKGSENYAARIVEIGKCIPIVGKDLIQTTTVVGNTVIISKSMKEGDIGVYFVSGTRLSPEYCKGNNLYDSAQENNDQSKKGYISFKKRRIRPLKLGNIISDGLIMPLTSVWQVENVTLTDFKIGDEFTHINDKLVCDKYFVPIRNSNIGGSEPKKEKVKLRDIIVPNQFRFHHETSHLGKNIDNIKPDSELIITSKLHGSSCILSRVKTIKKLSIKDRIAKFLGVNVVNTEYTGIYSSGKPKSGTVKGIDSKWTNDGQSFYKDNIWKICYDDYKYALEDGISIYGEICNEKIQGKYDYSKLRQEGKGYTFVVYRITRTNDSGNVDEFSWNQVEQYCNKHGLQTVPVLFKGNVGKYFNWSIDEHPFNDITIEYAINNKLLDYLSDTYLEVKCSYCVNDVWAEGICVRIENPYQVYKLKSKNFLLGEDKQLEEGITNVEDEN